MDKDNMITEELQVDPAFAQMIKESAEHMSDSIPAEDFIEWLNQQQTQ